MIESLINSLKSIQSPLFQTHDHWPAICMTYEVQSARIDSIGSIDMEWTEMNRDG